VFISIDFKEKRTKRCPLFKYIIYLKKVIIIRGNLKCCLKIKCPK
jgi:hypothetical protein